MADNHCPTCGTPIKSARRCYECLYGEEPHEPQRHRGRSRLRRMFTEREQGSERRRQRQPRLRGLFPTLGYGH